MGKLVLLLIIMLCSGSILSKIFIVTNGCNRDISYKFIKTSGDDKKESDSDVKEDSEKSINEFSHRDCLVIFTQEKEKEEVFKESFKAVLQARDGKKIKEILQLGEKCDLLLETSSKEGIALTEQLLKFCEHEATKENILYFGLNLAYDEGVTVSEEPRKIECQKIELHLFKYDPEKYNMSRAFDW